jgi:hypothetical protein
MNKPFAVRSLVNADEARGLSGSNYQPAVDANGNIWHTSFQQFNSPFEAAKYALKVPSYRQPHIIAVQNVSHICRA